MLRRIMGFVVLVGLCLLTDAAQAQYEFGEGVFSGQGTARIERPASQMKMQVEISASGSDVKAAAKALEERLGTARETVTALGAKANSVKVDGPRVKVEQENQQQRLMAQMRRQLGRGGRAAKAVDVPKVVTVSAKLTAEWDLGAGAPTEMLAKTYDLQKSLREAKLAGEDAQAKLTPEEQEMLEEASMYNSSDEPKPGEPTFVYLAAVSEAERAAATKEAFAKARAAAERLAVATGGTLGELQSLRVAETGSADESMDDSMYSYNSPLYAMMRAARGIVGETDDIAQAVGPEPGKLVYKVQAYAGFAKGK